MSLRPAHIRQIAGYSMRYSMRTGGGLMYLIVLLVSGLSIAAVFVTPLENLIDGGSARGMSDDPAEMAEMIVKLEPVRNAVTWITGGDDAQSQHLLEEKPALMSAIMLFLLVIIPYTTCLGAFNQTSSDIASKGLRFLLLRTERTNIYLGRLIGAALFTCLWSAAVVLLIVLYIHFKFGIYPPGALLGWGLQGWFAMLLLSLPYLALCAWISGKVDSAFGSLAICLVVSGFSIFFLFFLKVTLTTNLAIPKEYLTWLYRVIPWGWKYDTLHPSIITRASAVVAQLSFTALFMLFGIRSFNRRDR